jgi:23S rRNA maturation-related 3'-5' exoribonuclease YhaM
MWKKIAHFLGVSDYKTKKYYDLDELLSMIDEPNQATCRRLYQDNKKVFEKAPGSSHNHQAWEGGYLDHVRETMNIGVVLFDTLNGLRKLPFTLSDALLVLYIHDLEKPWKYSEDEKNISFQNKKDRHFFREKKLQEYKIQLTDMQNNAFCFVEGENNETYSASRRGMNELAAFCHMCDVTSARLWYDFPCKSSANNRNRNWNF